MFKAKSCGELLNPDGCKKPWVNSIMIVHTYRSMRHTGKYIVLINIIICRVNLQMVTIVIPTFNEQEIITALVHFLKDNGGGALQEIIVADGGSTDQTLEFAAKAGARAVLSPEKGRAAQMNHGASVAKGDILYFVHADTFPPPTFAPDIEKSVQDGFLVGRYQTKFDSTRAILKLNAFFTRFDLFMCYGGDQTLFMEKRLFDKIGGFDTSMRIMEDYEIIERAKKLAKYKILSGKVLVSARKYDTNSWLRVQKANYTIVRLYKRGASQQEMVNKYKELLDYR